MTDKIDDGGPAFPGGWPEAQYEPYYGMSLRDWFAGQALANRYTMEDSVGNLPEVDLLAEYAYWVADAMLAARKKGGGQ